MFHLKKLEDVADFNPSEHIPKGTRAKKIAMEKLSPFERKISGFEYAPYSGGAKFRNKDTLVAKITPCLENGKTCFVDILEPNEIAFGSTEFIVLRPKTEDKQTSKIDHEFLYYLSISPAFRSRAISCMEGTSGRKRINEFTLKKTLLPIPEYSEQKGIAKLLSAIDKKISLNRKINDNLSWLDHSSTMGVIRLAA